MLLTPVGYSDCYLSGHRPGATRTPEDIKQVCPSDYRLASGKGLDSGGTMDWFQIGKGVCQGCILSPCLFNLYAEYIMRNAGLDEVQDGNIEIVLTMLGVCC